MIYLAQGDLEQARQVIRQTPPEIEPTDLVGYIASYWDLYWLLDDAQQRLLLRLRPSAFDDDRGNWGEVMAETYALRGDLASSRAYADSARVAFEAQLQASPTMRSATCCSASTLAYLGRKAEA